jgi:hypothetical protein
MTPGGVIPGGVKLLFSLKDRYEASALTEPPLDELLAEDQVILSQYLRGLAGATSDPAERPVGEGAR